MSLVQVNVACPGSPLDTPFDEVYEEKVSQPYDEVPGEELPVLILAPELAAENGTVKPIGDLDFVVGEEQNTDSNEYIQPSVIVHSCMEPPKRPRPVLRRQFGIRRLPKPEDESKYLPFTVTDQDRLSRHESDMLDDCQFRQPKRHEVVLLVNDDLTAVIHQQVEEDFGSFRRHFRVR